MSVTKAFLAQFIRDKIYPNNSRLVKALDVQEVLLQMTSGLALNQDFELGEVATGVKWIDGKEIYRRVINLDPYLGLNPVRDYVSIQLYMGSYFKVEHVQVIKSSGVVCDLSSNDIRVSIDYSQSFGMIMYVSEVNPLDSFVSGYAVVSYTKGESTSY